MDQKNHHKIPLNPPFPKGEPLLPPFGKACLPVGREGWEGFYKVFSNR